MKTISLICTTTIASSMIFNELSLITREKKERAPMEVLMGIIHPSPACEAQ
jgi:hypothetical protein